MWHLGPCRRISGVGTSALVPRCGCRGRCGRRGARRRVAIGCKACNRRADAVATLASGWNQLERRRKPAGPDCARAAPEMLCVRPLRRRPGTRRRALGEYHEFLAFQRNSACGSVASPVARLAQKSTHKFARGQFGPTQPYLQQLPDKQLAATICQQACGQVHTPRSKARPVLHRYSKRSPGGHAHRRNNILRESGGPTATFAVGASP
mmetsp:Transcript_9955/g.19158  ORF Transcript_9955/g.19158 Transcript_9955/m.19158 type:complete len:208 (-) Transcript_9955:1106-1729(-)